MHWYLAGWKKYAVFSGRARRGEYWTFMLLNMIFFFVLSAVDEVAGLTLKRRMGILSAGQGLLSTTFFLAVLMPSITISVRRLHDTGRSGFWLLIVVFLPPFISITLDLLNDTGRVGVWLFSIPCIGALALFVFFVRDSQPGSNKYGANPKGPPRA